MKDRCFIGLRQFDFDRQAQASLFTLSVNTRNM